jgi:hypothetical protein
MPYELGGTAPVVLRLETVKRTLPSACEANAQMGALLLKLDT